MRRLRMIFALLAPGILSGCGFIHFGRRPEIQGDAAMATAYSSLATEHKILKQELLLVRRQGDTLRAALERGATGGRVPDGPNDLAARLTETSRELAALRVSHAQLQAEAKPASTSAVSATAPQPALEARLASAERAAAQLQEENARLRTEVDRTRNENLTLAEQLGQATVRADRSQLELAQLNTDLLAQKEARARADQASEALRTQLTTVLAHRPAATPPGEGAREAPNALPPLSLQSAKAPPAGSSPTAELRLNTATLRPVEEPQFVAEPGRTHIVKAGETLEKISRQYFGTAERWNAIYEANSAQLSNGQPMRAGMELRIPEN